MNPPITLRWPRMQLILEPSPRKFGPRGGLTWRPLRYLRPSRWWRSLAPTMAAQVPAPGCPAQCGADAPMRGSNAGATLRFQPVALLSRPECEVEEVPNGNSNLCCRAAEPLWAVSRAGEAGVGGFVPSLAALVRWRLTTCRSSRKINRG